MLLLLLESNFVRVIMMWCLISFQALHRCVYFSLRESNIWLHTECSRLRLPFLGHLPIVVAGSVTIVRLDLPFVFGTLEANSLKERFSTSLLYSTMIKSGSAILLRARSAARLVVSRMMRLQVTSCRYYSFAQTLNLQERNLRSEKCQSQNLALASRELLAILLASVLAQ